MKTPGIHRTSHVVSYIKSNHPQLDPRKFSIAKIGARVYMFAVDSQGFLQRKFIFQGNLPAINELSILRTSFERNVASAIKELGY
jgi:hypothetical protein